VTRRDEVQALKGRGLATRQIAAELGISQTRVCQLLNTTQANTVQPGATATQPNTVQPDEAALRAQHWAEFRAAFEPKWNALSAENAELRGRLETQPAAGSCPGCRGPLVPVCPRCAGLDPDA
jgi:hypothetical protein